MRIIVTVKKDNNISVPDEIVSVDILKTLNTIRNYFKSDYVLSGDLENGILYVDDMIQLDIYNIDNNSCCLNYSERFYNVIYYINHNNYEHVRMGKPKIDVDGFDKVENN